MAVDRFPVEEGSILLFARSIGDPNPIYADRDHAAAHRGRRDHRPAHLRAVERPVRPRLPAAAHSSGEPWFGSGRHPTGRARTGEASGGGGARHAGSTPSSTTSTTGRCGVGDVLTATTRPGESWEKQGRSGKLVFSETITEYRDADGELVVTARAVGVMTEHAVRAGELTMALHAERDRGRRPPRELVLVDDLTRTQIVQYAGASGDYNPLHTDEVFATRGRRLPAGVRPRDADHGHDRPHPHRLGRRRPAAPLRRPLRQAGVAGRHAHRHGRGRPPSARRTAAHRSPSSPSPPPTRTASRSSPATRPPASTHDRRDDRGRRDDRPRPPHRRPAGLASTGRHRRGHVPRRPVRRRARATSSSPRATAAWAWPRRYRRRSTPACRRRARRARSGATRSASAWALRPC